MSQVYFILEDLQKDGGTYIVGRNNGLRIRVFSGREARNFKPDADEIQLYATDERGLLIFETMHISAEDAIDMIDAVHYYARYRKNPDMEILPERPQKKQASSV